MDLFNKLFGRGKKDTGPLPTRPLNLSFELVPENGVNFAEQFHGAVKVNESTDLDYSVNSLKFVDDFLQRFREEKLAVNDFAETIFVAGCYVGEVMVRNHAGVWMTEQSAGLPEGLTMMPIVIKLPDGVIADPIAKAFKRFYHGEEDNLFYYYHVVVTDREQ